MCNYGGKYLFGEFSEGAQAQRAGVPQEERRNPSAGLGARHSCQHLRKASQTLHKQASQARIIYFPFPPPPFSPTNVWVIEIILQLIWG